MIRGSLRATGVAGEETKEESVVRPGIRRKWGAVDSRALWGDKPVLARAGELR